MMLLSLKRKKKKKRFQEGRKTGVTSVIRVLGLLTFWSHVWALKLAEVGDQSERKQKIFLFANGISLVMGRETFLHQTFIECVLCTRHQAYWRGDTEMKASPLPRDTRMGGDWRVKHSKGLTALCADRWRLEKLILGRTETITFYFKYS